MALARPASRVAFIGSKELGYRVLTGMLLSAPAELAVIITLDDVADQRSVLAKFRDLAMQSGVPLRILKRGGELESAIRETAPDLCVVAGWYHILSGDMLELAPHGFVGVHASLLPEYRGGAPLVWALMHGKRRSGVTLFYFDTGMDTGDVIGQRSFSIEPADTIADALRRAEDTAVRLVGEFYPLLLAGTAPRKPQVHASATYCAMRSPADGRITWRDSAAELYNFVRAQTFPYPGAFCELADGRRLTIWTAAVFPHAYAGSPGKVAALLHPGVIVTCGGNSALHVQRVQLGGTAPADAAEILRVGWRLC